MPEFEWDMNIENLKNGIVAVDKKAQAAVEMYAKNQSKMLESYAKQKAPWTDRTGMARKSLNATTEKKENGIRITLAHGVDYGLWLELAHEKRFAIVKPTIELKGNDVLKGYENLLGKIGY